MQQTHSPKPIPPVADLFTQAWDLFTEKVFKLFVLWLIGAGANILGLIVLLLLAGSFAFSRIYGNLSDPMAILESLMTTDFMLTAGVLLFLYIIFAIVVGLAYTAAAVMILHDKTKDVSTWGSLKKGFAYGWPLFTTGLIAGILMLGGLFVVVIPYIIMAVFFMFMVYVIVLENKKGQDALRQSAGMVGQNFWGIIGRLIIFWVAYMLIFGLLPNFIEGNTSKSFSTFFALAHFVLSIAAGWYSMCYLYVLYTHARSAYDESRPGSITWMWVIAIIGFILAALIGTGFYNASTNKSSGMRQFFQQLKTSDSDRNSSYKEYGEDSVPLALQDDAVLNAVNVLRTENALNPILYDQPLCAYATRRLKQLKDFGGFDDYAGFIEDTADSLIWDSYFKGYRMVNTFNRDRMPTDSAQTIAERWSTNKDRSITVLNPEFTNACVRLNEEYVVIVVGAKE